MNIIHHTRSYSTFFLRNTLEELSKQPTQHPNLIYFFLAHSHLHIQEFKALDSKSKTSSPHFSLIHFRKDALVQALFHEQKTLLAALPPKQFPRHTEQEAFKQSFNQHDLSSITEKYKETSTSIDLLFERCCTQCNIVWVQEKLQEPYYGIHSLLHQRAHQILTLLDLSNQWDRLLSSSPKNNPST